MDAVMDLLRNPEEFLRKHPIINTFDCKASGTTDAYFKNDRAGALRPGSKLSTLSMKMTESYNLESVGGQNAYGYRFPVQGVYTAPSDGTGDDADGQADGMHLHGAGGRRGCD